jgi:ketosteroid isomerase-like protein
MRVRKRCGGSSRTSATRFRTSSSVERLEPIGADRVLALLRVSATGRASGITAGADVLSTTGRDMATATVYDLADGKVRRIRVFLDRQKAFEAVGRVSRGDRPR